MNDRVIPIDIYDSVSGAFVDVLQVALLDVASTTHLPEIFTVFGREMTLKFLDVFSGTTVTVPSREILDDCMRDVAIYIRLSKSTEDGRSMIVRDMAIRYDMTPGQVRKSFVRMEERLQRYKFHDKRK